MQKRAYKLLAYILEERQDFGRQNFQEVLDSLLLGVASSMSAAKRFRLRCLQVRPLAFPQSIPTNTLRAPGGLLILGFRRPRS